MGKVVDPKNARSEDYRAVLKKIEAGGKCPFCPKNFNWHRKPLLRRSGRWLITEASWPYKNAKFHFLIIGGKHTERVQKLTAEDFRDILFLLRWAVKRFGIAGGALSLRFGDMAYTGATVRHLHFHLIVPKLGRADKALVVNFPIG